MRIFKFVAGFGESGECLMHDECRFVGTNAQVLWQRGRSTKPKVFSISVRSRKRHLLAPVLFCIIVLSILHLSILIDIVSIYCSIIQNSPAQTRNRSCHFSKPFTTPCQEKDFLQWTRSKLATCFMVQIGLLLRAKGGVINNYIWIPGMNWDCLR